jgi:hypothetical protein
MQSTPPNESRLTVLCETLNVTEEGVLVFAVRDWAVGNWVRHRLKQIETVKAVNRKRMRKEATTGTKEEATTGTKAEAEATFTEANWQTTIDGDPKDLLLGTNAIRLILALISLLNHCDPTNRIDADLIIDLAGRLAAMAPVTVLPPAFWAGRPLDLATYLADLPDMLTKLGMGAAAKPKETSIPLFGAFNTARAVKTYVMDMTYADEIGAAMHERPARCVIVHGVSGSGTSTTMALAA